MTTWPRSIALAAGGGLVVGVLTSFGQTVLPDPIRSLANASSPWSAAAFALAYAAGGRDVVRRAVLGGVALFGMLAGYDLTTLVRGFAISGSVTLFWAAAAITAGPVLGIGAAWSQGQDERKAGAGVAALAAILVGEAIFGLTYIADSTSPVYWTGQLLVGLGLVATVGWRRRNATAFAVCAALTAAGAIAFYLVYPRLTALG
jgi:hypothetical protein